MIRKTRKWLIILGIGFAAAACSSTSQPTEDNQELTPISIQLSWVHEYSSAPFHTAVANGHFADQGLEATLVEGGFGEDGFIDPIREVLDGNVDFAMADGSSLIEARANGLPVVAIASLIQRSPDAVISLAENPIVKPEDMLEQRISVASGGATTIFTTLIESQNIDSEQINLVERTSFGIEPLLEGEVDGIYGWIVNEGVSVTEQGYEPVYLLMSDYGIETYTFVMFTTQTMLEERPEVAQGVVDAIRLGLGDVVDDPTLAIEHTLVYNTGLDAQAQLRRLEATIPLFNLPGQPLGGMDKSVWEFTQEILLEQGILEEAIVLEDLYDLSFVDTPTLNSDGDE